MQEIVNKFFKYIKYLYIYTFFKIHNNLYGYFSKTSSINYITIFFNGSRLFYYNFCMLIGYNQIRK